jgi:type IV pilus assembly protein PilA
MMNTLLRKAKGFTLVELMVVIVIVGILAAVAIPKFMDASHKAKASEFPTNLTAIYTGQTAYIAERGSFATGLQPLKDSAGVDVASTSKWFNYATTGNATTFSATAVVATPFGSATSTDQGYIDQANTKSCTAALQKYCPSWK